MEKTLKIIFTLIGSFWIQASAHALSVAPIKTLDEAVGLSDEIVLGTISGSYLNQGTRGVFFRTYGIQVEKCLGKTLSCPKETYFKQPDAYKMGIPGLPVWREGVRSVFFLWKHVVTGVYTVFTLDEKTKKVTGPLNGKAVSYPLATFEKMVAQAKPYKAPQYRPQPQPKKVPQAKGPLKKDVKKPTPTNLKAPNGGKLQH